MDARMRMNAGNAGNLIQQAGYSEINRVYQRYQAALFVSRPSKSIGIAFHDRGALSA